MSTSQDGAATRRRYHSPAREAAARDTRRRIRDAARRLFVESGYAATSVRAVAAAAGVAEKTVYLQFEGKAAILKEVVDAAIVGDEVGVSAVRQQWFLAVAAEPALGRRAALLAEGTSALHERTGPVFAVAREASTVDAEVATLWGRGKRRHLADMRTLAVSFDEHGLLPPGRGVDWATDLLYVLLGPESWSLVRRELGRDAPAYREWLEVSLLASFGGTPETLQRHPASSTPPGTSPSGS
jgi:AcrR family transcriptional regulator